MSRWNLLSGYEKLIMQFKEKVQCLQYLDNIYTISTQYLHNIYNIYTAVYYLQVPGGQETGQKVMLVTPERTSVLECTESSQTFR